MVSSFLHITETLVLLWFPGQDSGFLDGSFEALNGGLLPLSRLLYDTFVKSILQIVSKLDLSVQKVSGEEVRAAAQHPRSTRASAGGCLERSCPFN